jgi:hypothetical protein
MLSTYANEGPDHDVFLQNGVEASHLLQTEGFAKVSSLSLRYQVWVAFQASDTMHILDSTLTLCTYDHLTDILNPIWVAPSRLKSQNF